MAPDGIEPVPIRLASLGDPVSRTRVRWLLLAFAVLLLLGWAASQAMGVTVPVLLAAVLAYFFAPLVSHLQRRGMPRGLVVALLVVTVTTIVAAVAIQFGPLAIQRLEQLPHDLAASWQRLTELLHERFGVRIESDPRRLFGFTPETQLDPDDLRDIVTRWVSRGASLFSVFIIALSVPILSLFFLYYYERILAWFESLIPPRHRQRVEQTMREVDQALGGFIRGQFVVGLILTTLYTLGFWIVGAPYPVLLGIVSEIGNFIPYAGTLFGMALAALLNVLQGESLTTIALTMVVFGVVQALEAWVITPRIVGRRVGLSPLAVLLAVLLFADLFGLVGVFMAVPAAAILRILGSIVLRSYRRSPFYRTGNDDLAPGRPCSSLREVSLLCSNGQVLAGSGSLPGTQDLFGGCSSKSSSKSAR